MRDPFNDLCDAVCCSIFGLLSPIERCCMVGAVCRRFRRLTADTPLPPRLELAVVCGSWLGEHVASLRAWLERHGGRLQQLELLMKQRRDRAVPTLPPREYEEVAAQAEAELLAGLQAAFGSRPAGCEGALSLRLELARPTCVSASWLPALAGLSSLQLSSEQELRLAAPLAALTALRHLSLSFGDYNVLELSSDDGPGYSLPASLTSLALANDSKLRLSPQITALTRLERLRLDSVHYVQSSLDVLAGLPKLHKLSLIDCDGLPECLRDLTGLEALCWDGPFAADSSDAAIEELDWALGPLTNLTSLWFGDASRAGSDWDWSQFWEEGPPGVLARLPRLSTLAWLATPSQPWLPDDTAWLGRIRRLALPLQVVSNNLDQLQQRAAALEALTVVDRGCEYRSPSDDVPLVEAVQLAGHIPALRLLSLSWVDDDGKAEVDFPGMTAWLSNAMAAARRANPALRIDCCGALLRELRREHA